MAVRVSTEADELTAEAPEPGRPVDRSVRRWVEPLGVVGLVALVASPIVLGALSLVGDTWLPMSDWASLLHRTAQVGTKDTPLVGPYSWHGFAHPGPLLFWVAAPLYRLTGEDPRSLLWTGALVNVLCVAGIGAVAWRRGRWALLVASMILVALLIHGIEPDRLVDLWNPYVALLPFLLTIFLAADAALGRRRALLEAVVPASFAAQSHLGFVSLVLLVAVWLVAWLVVSSMLRELPPSEGGSSLNIPTKTLMVAAAIGGVLWLPPILDAVFGVHNPKAVIHSLRGPGATLGFGEGIGVVGRYLQPTGDWVHSGDPPIVLRADGTDAVALVVLVALLLGCAALGYWRRLADVVVASTLSLTLVVGAVPVASQVIENAPSYLVQWIKVIAAVSWGTVGWTAWRLATHNRDLHVARWVRALAIVPLALAVGWSWGIAVDLEPPEGADPQLLAEVRGTLKEELDPDAVYRLVFVNDGFSFVAGMTHWMTEDGFDVVTDEGAPGLKWGIDQRWRPGEPYDAVLTFAVQLNDEDEGDAYDVCSADPDVEMLVDVDQLTPEQHELVDTVAAKLVFDPASLTPEELDQAGFYAAHQRQLRVFIGPEPCGP
jgi:hypothetical protein